jgi:hypothetical protein
MKILKFRYIKIEREHEHKEELVISAKETFEKPCSGLDDSMQSPAFDHDNQNPFLDTERTTKEFNFAIKISESHRARDWMQYSTLYLAVCQMEI